MSDTSKNGNDSAYFDGFTRNSIISIAIFIAVIVLFALGEFILSTPAEPVQYLFFPESDDLTILREHEESVLNSYRIIDENEGTYGIPVERAMELYLQEAHSR